MRHKVSAQLGHVNKKESRHSRVFRHGARLQTAYKVVGIKATMAIWPVDAK